MKKIIVKIIDGAAVIKAAKTDSCQNFRIADALKATTQRQQQHRLVLLICCFCCCLLQLPMRCAAVGYSYARFIGPVRGPEHKVLVHDAHSGTAHVDYVAQPEYEFAYGVEDAQTRVLQNRKETRIGDAVQGVYSVVDPDGTLRVVKYTADNVNGFQAEIITNGVTRSHGHGDRDEQPRLQPPPPSAAAAPVAPTQYQHHHTVQHVPQYHHQQQQHHNNVAQDVVAVVNPNDNPEGLDEADLRQVQQDYDERVDEREEAVSEERAHASHDDASDDDESAEDAYEDASKEAQGYAGESAEYY